MQRHRHVQSQSASLPDGLHCQPRLRRHGAWQRAPGPRRQRHSRARGRTHERGKTGYHGWRAGLEQRGARGTDILCLDTADATKLQAELLATYE